MSLGEAWWLLDCEPAVGAAAILDLLDRHGLHYRHPADESIYVFDDVGSRRESSVVFVSSEWAARRDLTLQLWIDADSDVVTSVEDEGTRIVFGLDGLLRQEAERVVAGLVLSACVIAETRALVVDRHLPDSGPEWLARLRSTPTSPRGEADLLLRKEGDSSCSVRLGRNSWLRSQHL